ncbi:MAG: hypothetical protein U0350_28495 [Caldilineaceae bacterium]
MYATLMFARLAHLYSTSGASARLAKLILATTLFLVLLGVSTYQPLQAQATTLEPATAATIYLPYVSVPSTDQTIGASDIVGEKLEACVTEQTAPNALVLAPTDDWQNAIIKAAPGTTLLLHGGVYQASDKIWLPSGQADQWITLKPYNCETVTLYTSLRPGSYNVIAGLHLEALGIGDLTWAIRIDGKNKGPVRHLIIRNNTIFGGEKDALKVSADVADVLITGNHIDGGKASHNLNVQSEGVAAAPDQIVISNNLLTKQYFNSVAEDMLQVIDAGNIEFSHNTCANGPAMEQCVDIKETRAPLNIHHNLFAGDTLHTTGPGVDGSAGCMVIHEHNKQPENHLIEQNLFRNCRDTVIRFASEGGNAMARATVRANVFVNPDATDADAILIWRAQDVVFENNTMIRGTLKLGADGDPTKIPQNTVLKNNIFYQTNIADRTQAPAAYQCGYNLFFKIAGNLAQTRCQNSLWDVDPLLADPAAAAVQPAANSPACNAGESGANQGAFGCGKK